MGNTNINNMSIEQLKAIAYDVVKQRIIAEQNLMQIERAIEQKQQVIQKETEKKEKKK